MVNVLYIGLICFQYGSAESEVEKEVCAWKLSGSVVENSSKGIVSGLGGALLLGTMQMLRHNWDFLCKDTLTYIMSILIDTFIADKNLADTILVDAILHSWHISLELAQFSLDLQPYYHMMSTIRNRMNIVKQLQWLWDQICRHRYCRYHQYHRHPHHCLQVACNVCISVFATR